MAEPEKEEKYVRSTDDAMDAMKNMDLTSEEYGKFEKAFKDPEFMKMFVEYAKEIESPEAKAETDAYLRQVENEGRTKEVYGDVSDHSPPLPHSSECKHGGMRCAVHHTIALIEAGPVMSICKEPTWKVSRSRTRDFILLF